jgi:hypothetical protein
MEALLLGESSFDCDRRLYGEVWCASREGDMVVRVTDVADAFDRVDLVVRFIDGESSLVGDLEDLAFDLVFLAGPVAGTATVCNSPTLWPSSGTSINISPNWLESSNVLRPGCESSSSTWNIDPASIDSILISGCCSSVSWPCQFTISNESSGISSSSMKVSWSSMTGSGPRPSITKDWLLLLCPSAICISCCVKV